MNQPFFEKKIFYNFSKKNRILKPSEFKSIFSEGQKFFNSGLVLVCKFNSSLVKIVQEAPEAKIGFAISKKNLRFAHDRKRLKRLVIEYFRHHKHLFKGGEFVIALNRLFKKEQLIASNHLNKVFDKLWGKYCAHFKVSGIEKNEHFLDRKV